MVALASGLLGCEDQRQRTLGIRFTPLEEGVEYARFRVPERGGHPAFDGHAFRVDLESVGLRVLAAGGPSMRRDVRTITRALDRAVAVNGSFFDPEGRAMGLVVDQGRLIARRRNKAWGALVVKGRRAFVTKGAEVKLKEGPTLVIQGQPRLVQGGEVPGLKPQTAARTVVCLDEGGGNLEEGSRRLTFVVTSAVDATRLAELLAAHPDEGGMGCGEALNLDGGPSTQLVARLGALRVEIEGDEVPNALVAIPGLPGRADAPPAPIDVAEGPAAENDGGAEGAVSAP